MRLCFWFRIAYYIIHELQIKNVIYVAWRQTWKCSHIPKLPMYNLHRYITRNPSKTRIMYWTPLYNPHRCITRTLNLSFSGNRKCYPITPCRSFNVYPDSNYFLPYKVHKDIVKGHIKDYNRYCIDWLLQNWTLFYMKIENRAFDVFEIGVLPALGWFVCKIGV